jgi:hypothetical protein
MRAANLLILTLTLVLWGTSVQADGKERVTPVTDPATLKRCADCHMVYPAEFLPERSWRALLEKLENHFGDDASVPEAERRQILAYLTANAGDRSGSKQLKGLSAGVTPLRITELPRWVREHEKEVSAAVWALPSVKSRSNCPACHVNAHLGDFSERALRVPSS